MDHTLPITYVDNLNFGGCFGFFFFWITGVGTQDLPLLGQAV
jgi:hypothetical protein